jgi:hypothetical protein
VQPLERAAIQGAQREKKVKKRDCSKDTGFSQPVHDGVR